MLKNKNVKKLLILTIIFSLLTAFAPLPREAKAASLQNASDTLSDSMRSAIATHTIEFTTTTTTPAQGYFEVTLADEFGDAFIAGDITCSTGTPSKPSARVAKCSLGAVALPAASTVTITVNNVQNPDPGVETPTSYLILVKSYNQAGTTLYEKTDLRVAIIDEVIVTAKVDASLTFTIGAMATGTAVNGTDTTGFGATSSLEFGTLAVDATSTLGQRLFVTTNADDGYTVTVEQDHELLSNSSSTINSFDNAPDWEASTTPKAWTDPKNLLDQYDTYGHMGLTSEDASLDDTLWAGAGTPSNPFNVGNGATYWAGLKNTQPMQVMFHTGPSDGQTPDKGYTEIAYSIKVASLQEAGDYTNTLTYICTPTF